MLTDELRELLAKAVKLETCDSSNWKLELRFGKGDDAERAMRKFSATLPTLLDQREADAARDERLGEALYALSARLLLTKWLEDDENHAAYEKVVAAFGAPFIAAAALEQTP